MDRFGKSARLRSVPAEKQIAANRRNALKSSGPRTPRGKAFTRVNALRHGLRATAITPTGESLKELDQIRRRYMLCCQPQAPEQVRLLEQMVNARWRLLYWQKTEARILGESLAAVSLEQIALSDRLSQRQARYASVFRKAYRAYQRSTRALIGL
jgi:hypothetical protein